MNMKIMATTPLPLRIGWSVAAITLGMAVVAPFFLSGYQLFMMSQIIIYSAILLGLNLLTGYNGQISLGHSALVGIGAYVAAVLIAHYGVAWWITPVISGAVCFIVGWLFGYPALRLKGHYLALATLAFSLTFPQILKIDALERWTGGVAGLAISTPEKPGWMPFSADVMVYLYVLLVVAILFALTANLIFSQTGRVLVAIRDHPTAAITMGMNLSHFKTMAFGLSSASAGVGGALSALTVHYVSPDSFNLMLSVMLLIGIVAGGLVAIEGAILGAAFVVVVPNYTTSVSQSATTAVFAAILILVLAISPMGLADVLRKALVALFGADARQTSAPTPPAASQAHSK